MRRCLYTWRAAWNFPVPVRHVPELATQLARVCISGRQSASRQISERRRHSYFFIWWEPGHSNTLFRQAMPTGIDGSRGFEKAFLLVAVDEFSVARALLQTARHTCHCMSVGYFF